MTKKLNLIARNFKVIRYNYWYFNLGIYDYSYFNGLIINLYYIIARFLKRFFFILLTYQINVYLNNFYLHFTCYKNFGYIHNKFYFYHEKFTRIQKKKLTRLQLKQTKNKKLKYYIFRYFKEKNSFLKTQYLFQNLFKFILEDFLKIYLKRNIFISLNNYLQLFQYIFSNKFFYINTYFYTLTLYEAKNIYSFYLKTTTDFLIRNTYARFKKFLKFIIYILFGFFLTFQIFLLVNLLAYYLQKIKRHIMFLSFIKKIYQLLNNFNITYYTIKVQITGRINGTDRKQKYITYFGSKLDIAFSRQNYQVEIKESNAVSFTPDGILNIKLIYFSI